VFFCSLANQNIKINECRAIAAALAGNTTLTTLK
jgi:hypothetical protein